VTAASTADLAGQGVGGDLLADDVVLCVLGLGQSWMQGGNRDRADPLATPRAEHPGFALQLDPALRPAAGQAPRLMDLHELEGGDRRRERPLSGCADAIERGLVARIGRPRPLLMISAARGGSTLAGGRIPQDGLLPGAMAYEWLLAQAAAAARLMESQGRRLVVISIIAAHGETDAALGTSGEAFGRGWRRIRREADAAIAGLTGQARPVLLHTYQTAGLDRRSPQKEGCMAAQVAWSQLALADLDPLCRCVGPVYWTTPGPDDFVHVTNRSLRRVGLQFGRYVFDDVFGAGRRPLRAQTVAWAGERRLRVTYEREIAVESDDSRVNISRLGAGGGFDLEYLGAAAAPKIAAIEVRADDRRVLELVLDRPGPGGRGRLLVAARHSGPGVGRDAGGRTAVHSLAPLEVDPQDGCELYDWACGEALDLPPSPGSDRAG
jgi:hypothetical protein